MCFKRALNRMQVDFYQKALRLFRIFCQKILILLVHFRLVFMNQILSESSYILILHIKRNFIHSISLNAIWVEKMISINLTFGTFENSLLTKK